MDQAVGVVGERIDPAVWLRGNWWLARIGWGGVTAGPRIGVPDPRTLYPAI